MVRRSSSSDSSSNDDEGLPDVAPLEISQAPHAKDQTAARISRYTARSVLS